jgi:hypothetical protein
MVAANLARPNFAAAVNKNGLNAGATHASFPPLSKTYGQLTVHSKLPLHTSYWYKI